MASNPRRRGGKSLKRVAEKRPELRTVVVFTEGKNSEPDYINGLKADPAIVNGVALNLQVHPEHGVPLTLVDLAVACAEDPEVDECWCLFDVEWPKNHPNLHRAIDRAKAHGIKLAISNPCFELWLILHHRDYGKFSNSDDTERLSRRLDGRSGKSVDASIYIHLRKQAAKRAKKLAERHERNGTYFPNDNPSSGMYLFIESLESGC